MSENEQTLLFDVLPECATPVSEASEEWRDARLLQIIEHIRFNPERLAAYLAGPDADVGFLDFMIERLGGRSQ